MKSKILASLLLVSIVLWCVGADVDIRRGGGGIVTTNSPGNGSPPLFITAVTNADGTRTYYFSAPSASATNAQAPSQVLSNLVATVANNVTNIGTSNGVIVTGILYQAPVQVETNLQVLNNLNVIGSITVSNNVIVGASNRYQVASSTATLSNVFSVKYTGPNAQSTFTNPPTGFVSIQFSNNIPYAVQADGTITAMLSDGTGVGTAVYIDAAHTNITAKGLTILNAEDREVVTLSGTTPIIDATNSPAYYIELSGNTTATISNLPVGRAVSLLVSNTSSTFSISGAAMYMNQNTTPSVTTNGYTLYQIFRPTTAVTQIWVLGRELELASSGPNYTTSTNATGTQLSFVVKQTITSNGVVVGTATNFNIIPGTNLVSRFTNEANQVTWHISSVPDGVGAGGTVIRWQTNTTVVGDLTNANFILGPNVFARATNNATTGAFDFYFYAFQTNFSGIMSTNGIMNTGPQTNTTDTYLDSTHIGSTLDVTGQASFAGIGALNLTLTNNITYLSTNMVPTGNGTNFAGNYLRPWNTFLMTNHFALTGMINVAAADLGRGWIVIGRNLSGGALKASVATTMRRAGTNFVSVGNNQNFRISVLPDGTGGVNETNQMADIQVYDAP